MTDLVRIPVIAPIDLMQVPSELDGQVGGNRAIGGRPQIAAQNDVDAIKAWLARFAGTADIRVKRGLSNQIKSA